MIQFFFPISCWVFCSYVIRYFFQIFLLQSSSGPSKNSCSPFSSSYLPIPCQIKQIFWRGNSHSFLLNNQTCFYDQHTTNIDLTGVNFLVIHVCWITFDDYKHISLYFVMFRFTLLRFISGKVNFSVVDENYRNQFHIYPLTI